MILSSHGIIGSSIGQFVGLLDAYPNAAAAYSLRKLRTAYTGSAIGVRRTNGDEMDIGFSNNELDTSALTTFANGGNVFVKTWYDQSGNARDATQTTAANQPQIVSSGSVITVNSKPAIIWDGVNDILNITLFSITNYSHFAVLTKVSSGTTAISLGNTNGQSVGVAFESNWYESATGVFISGGYNNNTNQNLFNVIKSGNAAIDFVFQQNNTTLATFTGAGFAGMNIEFIGARPNLFSTQNLQEIVLYNSIQTSNRTAIKDNINNFYSIY